MQEKGEDAARHHAGVIAQQVQAAFAARGLDASKYAFWCEDPLIEEIEEEVEVEEPVLNTVTYEEYETLVQDGRAVYTLVEKTRQEPAVDLLPVFNEDGTRRILPGRPARYSQDENGNETLLTAATEDTEATVSVPRTVKRTVRQLVSKQRLGENGAPQTRLGIRYTDLLVLMHAWTRRELGRTSQFVH